MGIDTQQNEILMLNQAFSAFSETTAKFQEAYSKLQEQSEYLAHELEMKNQVLADKMNELSQTHKYMNSILENVSDGVIAVDLEGYITITNQAAHDITGYSSVESRGKHYSEIFREWPIAEKGIGIHAIRVLSFKNGNETVVTKKGGVLAPVIAYTSKITDENAEVIGIVVTFNDLSKIKHLEKEIDRAKRLSALGEMAAGVAHEIRNPLGGIEMFASILERECKEDARKQKIASNIMIGVRSLNKIITEMLTFTRTFDKIHFSEVNLGEVLDSALMFVEHELREKKVRINKTLNLISQMNIKGDRDQLRQVFLNLILNAVQACQDDAHLCLGSFVDADSCSGIISIRDNGCGMSQDVLEKIFDPFYTTKANGTGLGLAVSYRIIEMHGGRITVDSTPGLGTVFSVVLPLL